MNMKKDINDNELNESNVDTNIVPCEVGNYVEKVDYKYIILIYFRNDEYIDHYNKNHRDFTVALPKKNSRRKNYEKIKKMIDNIVSNDNEYRINKGDSNV